MALTLTIASTDKTSLLRVNSIQIKDELNARNTMNLTLWDEAGSYSPSVGQAISLTDGATTYFAGTIDDVEKYEPQSTGDLVSTVECVDYNQICDRHLVARNYETTGQTLYDIVTDIVTQDLSGEGVTTTNVETGPTIDKAIFNYQTVTDCFNELAEATGYAWYIDYSKDLHFFAREANAAPFSLADAGTNYWDLRVRRTREKYRNRQFLRAGEELTDSQTEIFVGDGDRQTFAVGYPIGETPTISKNLNGAGYVAETVGIKQVDTGKAWYWSKGDPEIVQDSSETVLTSADKLKVVYKGLYPIIVQAEDDEQVDDRQTTEGGTGVYEAIEDDPRVETEELAKQRVEGLLRRFGVIPEIVTFQTDTGGLAAGQLINIQHTLLGLDGDYLIESVSARDIDGSFLRYSVKALSGEALGGWQEFFRKLAQMGRKFVIRDNEVLLLLRQTQDQINFTDTFTSSTSAPESRIDFALIGYSEISA